ncbi:hypothetical protein [Burkholderia gladioli]|uniref:hypothetical protein n=1 Tax=Burkholderia gladioli TaxID=28095 RepID=UPI000BEFB901|nr:hypothetical protein [Burkholderia gladioli]PEH83778.1 hypothetical protein CRM95_01650 [Burkholderia gladioli]
MTTEQIDVTQEQSDRIEAAWAICAYGNGRRIAGAWAKTFRACVQQVIGREVPESFALRVICA